MLVEGADAPGQKVGRERARERGEEGRGRSREGGVVRWSLGLSDRVRQCECGALLGIRQDCCDLMAGRRRPHTLVEELVGEGGVEEGGGMGGGGVTRRSVRGYCYLATICAHLTKTLHKRPSKTEVAYP
jgi:hypothetical protein